MALAQNLPDLSLGQYSHAGFNMDQQKGFDPVCNMLNQWGPGTDTAAGARGMLGQVGDYIGRTECHGRATVAGCLSRVHEPLRSGRARSGNQRASAPDGECRAPASGRGRQRPGPMADREGALQEAQRSQPSGNRLPARGRHDGAGLRQGNGAGGGQHEPPAADEPAKRQQPMQGANTMISSAGMLDSLLNSDFSRGVSVISDLLSTGAFQQNDMQNQLNAPYDALARAVPVRCRRFTRARPPAQPDNSQACSSS